MKKRRIITIVVTSIALILFLLMCVKLKSKNFNINVVVTNKTNADQDIFMSILLGKENNATNEKIMSLGTIKKGSSDNKKKTVNTPEGDFGLVLKINESDNSLYFTSSTKLSYINYDLEIAEASNGVIILKGEIKSKKVFSTIETKQIKPIVIKEEKK